MNNPSSPQIFATFEQRFEQGAGMIRARQWKEAESIYRAMVDEFPGAANAHYHLGIALHQLGRYAEAIAAFEAALALEPGLVEARNGLGNSLVQANRLVEAVEAYRQVVKARESYLPAWRNMAGALKNLHMPEEAIAVYRLALAQKPDSAELWTNLGVLFQDEYRPAEAIDAYRQALALQPDFLPALENLSSALQVVCDLDGAIECQNRITALRPDDVKPYDARLCVMHYHAGCDAERIHRETLAWNDRFARPLAAKIRGHDNDPSPQRRLRVGYVSPNFCSHCESLFTMPLLAHHDHGSHEIYGYSFVEKPDGVTARFQRQVDVWRTLAGWSDEAAAEQIRQDKIDILVDTALHMVGNRLLVFARKPAPVQVTWLGHAGTTGVEGMDYRLTDGRLDPLGSIEAEIRNPKSEIRINDSNPNAPISPGGQSSQQSLPHLDIGKLGFDSDFGLRASDFDNRISNFATQEPYYTEKSIRLPDSFWCYDPFGIEEEGTVDLPQSGPLPAGAAGYVTFGCLNNYCKVTERTLGLWAGVMAALPTAKLVMLAPPGSPRQRVLRGLGVGQERVSFVTMTTRRQYLKSYRRIDICLDTLPYNGGTTSLDALWMGVPVVTRVGPTAVGRAGWSHLHNLGLTELVAWSDEDFTKIAIALARDLGPLDQLRASLRRRMVESPLMDAPRFAGNMEAAYRKMWQAWCATRP